LPSPRASAHDPVGDEKLRSGAVVIEVPDDEPYDDEKDHTRCPDCKGSGYYVGFLERRLCPTCDGSGYM
jgi:DnaJ-class molecular chaperone